MGGRVVNHHDRHWSLVLIFGLDFSLEGIQEVAKLLLVGALGGHKEVAVFEEAADTANYRHIELGRECDRVLLTVSVHPGLFLVRPRVEAVHIGQ